jgi:hypothetical protein
MILSIYTLVHVLISLVGILSGFVVLFGMFVGKRLDGWTKVFLAMTVATSATGFGFPVNHFMPSHAVGIVSLIALAFATFARHPRRLAGGWRKIYVLGAVMALYLNVFVGTVQAFEKIAALKAIAPTQTEPPFALTQLVLLALFIALGIAAAIKFRSEPVPAA